MEKIYAIFPFWKLSTNKKTKCHSRCVHKILEKVISLCHFFLLLSKKNEKIHTKSPNFTMAYWHQHAFCFSLEGSIPCVTSKTVTQLKFPLPENIEYANCLHCSGFCVVGPISSLGFSGPFSRLHLLSLTAEFFQLPS